MKITATLIRDGKFWLVRVPEIGHSTQGRSLADAKMMARDLAATVRDIPIDDVELTEVRFELPDDVRDALARAAELRQESERANSEAAATVRGAARRLRAEGYRVRDIGEALGVSFQRAQQLISAG